MNIQRIAMIVMGLLTVSSANAADPWIVYDGFDGPGKGKHIVLVSGDEEYRSEETLPQLGKILAKHHGFKCTVLFAIDKDGSINPNVRENIPGLETLKTADLMVIFTRFRDLPDDQMKPIVAYLETGKPIVGLRTATHAFNIKDGATYAKFSYRSKDKEWQDGFGRQVLGETWISHHGSHGKESTRGVIAKGQEKHPILRGIKDGDIWGPTDVYGVRLPLPGDSQPLVMGEVLSGMKASDKPVEGKKNDPMMPIAWTKTFAPSKDKKARTFTTTMGASQDFESEGLRRLLVNACYWSLGMEEKIPEKSKVDLVGAYKARPFGNNGFAKGVKPADLAIREDGPKKATVSGVIEFKEKAKFEEGAIARVTLQDVSLADAPAKKIGEQVIKDPKEFPIAFEVEYDPAAIEKKHTYAIQVRIETKGRLDYINDTRVEVINNGKPVKDVKVPVIRVKK